VDRGRPTDRALRLLPSLVEGRTIEDRHRQGDLVAEAARLAF
jgi:hypothetical protein